MSGSGKTTLGKKLKEYFDEKNINSYIIDGDNVRSFYENDLGYGVEERKANVKRILFSAYVLEQNGIIPIVCNISPFQELRDFSKVKFDDYKEIYLKRNQEDILNKDEIYSQDNVVGKDMKFEEPNNPFLIVDTSKYSIEESLIIITRKLGL
ncbi:MAG: adenylyl-sulfate kinase [Candidatus Marinarcus sp.]|uniref:adenylyl-sulfate kinase n=1 Tax=Candidatus Marinarcus sp. TaxID=3100987 RepID=UPI003B00E448